jgi:hypothetical protein
VGITFRISVRKKNAGAKHGVDQYEQTWGEEMTSQRAKKMKNQQASRLNRTSSFSNKE